MKFSNRIFKRDVLEVLRTLSDGSVDMVYGDPGGDDGQLTEATWIAVDSQDRVYVVDGTRMEILLFDAEGNFFRRVGETGEAPEQFKGDVEGVGVDALDRLDAVAQSSSQIKIFDPEGMFLANLGEVGNGPGQFDKPQCLAIDLVRNHLIVTEENGNRLQVFDLADLE